MAAEFTIEREEDNVFFITLGNKKIVRNNIYMLGKTPAYQKLILFLCVS